MKPWQRFSRLKQRLLTRGLTMLELVFALGLLFISAGGVMTILVAGAGYPRRTQYMVIRDGLAKMKLDEITSSASPPTVAIPYSPYPDNPDYEFKVDVNLASFDSNSSWVHVTVKGPKPIGVESKLTAMMVKSLGGDLFASYACDSCHTIGTGPSGLGPNLNGTNLARGLAARNTALGGSVTLAQYIDESVRDPTAYFVIDPATGNPYTSSMTAYPTVSDMPAADVQALSNFLQSL